MIQYNVGNIRDLFGHKVNLKYIRDNPICCFKWFNIKLILHIKINFLLLFLIFDSCLYFFLNKMDTLYYFIEEKVIIWCFRFIFFSLRRYQILNSLWNDLFFLCNFILKIWFFTFLDHLILVRLVIFIFCLKCKCRFFFFLLRISILCFVCGLLKICVRNRCIFIFLLLILKLLLILLFFYIFNIDSFFSFELKKCFMTFFFLLLKRKIITITGIYTFIF